MRKTKHTKVKKETLIMKMNLEFESISELKEFFNLFKPEAMELKANSLHTVEELIKANHPKVSEEKKEDKESIIEEVEEVKETPPQPVEKKERKKKDKAEPKVEPALQVQEAHPVIEGQQTHILTEDGLIILNDKASAESLLLARAAAQEVPIEKEDTPTVSNEVDPPIHKLDMSDNCGTKGDVSIAEIQPISPETPTTLSKTDFMKLVSEIKATMKANTGSDTEFFKKMQEFKAEKNISTNAQLPTELWNNLIDYLRSKI